MEFLSIHKFQIKERGKAGRGTFPTRLNLYFDGVLVTLNHAGVGCHINGTYMGALTYADDITLGCPSVLGLN